MKVNFLKVLKHNGKKNMLGRPVYLEKKNESRQEIEYVTEENMFFQPSGDKNVASTSKASTSVENKMYEIELEPLEKETVTMKTISDDLMDEDDDILLKAQ